jgi:hypothetical protein
MRKLTAVLSAFALAVTLGACGEQGGNEPANSNNSGGSQEAATNLAALAQQIGERTAETNTAHMTMVMDVAGQKIDAEADVEFASDDLAMSMNMTLPGEGDMAMVLLDGIMYVQTPEPLEPGKSWLKIDPNGTDPMSKALGSTFDEMRKNADPRAAIDQLKDAGEITSQEEAELNGEQATHYTILVDFEKLVAQQDNPDAKKAAEMLEVKEFPVELWVNEDGLPMRMTMDMPMSDPSSGESVEAKIEADYTNWGEPVEIAAPPADQIAEMPGS